MMRFLALSLFYIASIEVRVFGNPRHSHNGERKPSMENEKCHLQEL